MVEIIQGTQAQVTVRLFNSDNGVQGDPLDLTSFTEIEACFINTDGSILTLSKTANEIVVLGNPLLGKIQLVFTAAQTALMAVTDHETLELDLIAGSADPVGIQIKDAYNVIKSRC